ncbi:MAG: radical SAM protein [Bacteroidales bacterium]|jgi:hypothetical protein|nr:radical SAM protein [Bacteroidales bacterium]
MEIFGIYQNDEDFISNARTFLRKTKDKWIIVWGTGKLLDTFLLNKGDDVDIKYFVDTNTVLQGQKVRGYDIRSPEHIRSEDMEKTMVMILVIGYERYLIENDLLLWGIPDYSYCFAFEFLLLNTYFKKSKVIVPMIYFFINSFCNLKCKHCVAHINDFVKNRNKFVPFELIKSDIDSFFKYVNYVGLLSFASGEVLLHPEFGKILHYICEKYKTRYSTLHFPTNGTILPQVHLLEVLSKYHCHVTIDDYTHAIKDRSKISDLTRLLKRHGVTYSINNTFQSGKYEAPIWDNVGNINISRNRTCEQNTNIYHKCALSLSCYNMYSGKLYSCGIACWSGFGGLYEPDGSDYVEFPPPRPNRRIIPDQQNTALSIIRLYTRATNKGYPAICDKCDGLGPFVNKNKVIAAEQL